MGREEALTYSESLPTGGSLFFKLHRAEGVIEDPDAKLLFRVLTTWDEENPLSVEARSCSDYVIDWEDVSPLAFKVSLPDPPSTLHPPSTSRLPPSPPTIHHPRLSTAVHCPPLNSPRSMHPKTTARS
jgi:hypothetical protein